MNAMPTTAVATSTLRRLFARRRAPAPPGWRGGVALIVDALVAATIAGVILALSAVAVAAHAAALHTEAQGVAVSAGARIVMEGADGTAALPLVATDIDVEVAGIVARTRVTQRFVNPTAEWHDGVYAYPLPDKAAVDTLRMQVGERVIEGEIQERGLARATYDAARRDGRKASLVDEARPNLFQTHFARLGPGETLVVTLEYQETLHYDSGSFRLRVPLAITPRYTPAAGADGPSPADVEVAADALPPDDDSVVYTRYLQGDTAPRNPVTLHVGIDAGFRLADVASVSHAVTITEGADHRYDVAFADEAMPADRDFELRWTPDVG
ncbi:MAG: hypothetical protein JSR18_07380, partial [Proteobacteria bacterium]|nr:hypothetical protein [Pseudomonadota bacterium]